MFNTGKAFLNNPNGFVTANRICVKRKDIHLLIRSPKISDIH